MLSLLAIDPTFATCTMSCLLFPSVLLLHLTFQFVYLLVWNKRHNSLRHPLLCYIDIVSCVSQLFTYLQVGVDFMFYIPHFPSRFECCGKPIFPSYYLELFQQPSYNHLYSLHFCRFSCFFLFTLHIQIQRIKIILYLCIILIILESVL